HKDDTCTLQPVSFGLSRQGDHYTVIDERTAAVFFPHAKAGDQVQLSKSSNGDSVLLSYGGEKLVLAYKAQPPTESERNASQFAVASDKTQVKGMILSRTGETLIVTSGGEKTTVVLTDDTKTRDDKGLFGLEKQYMA